MTIMTLLLINQPCIKCMNTMCNSAITWMQQNLNYCSLSLHIDISKFEIVFNIFSNQASHATGLSHNLFT